MNAEASHAPALSLPPSLWLMRHPRVELPEPTCYGASEVPLEPAHLQHCALRLAQQLPSDCQMLVSERLRSQALAQAVRVLRPDLPAWRCEPLLNEMDFGGWELVPWRAIPQQAVEAWIADFAHHRFGGKESVSDMLRRAQALRQLAWQPPLQPQDRPAARPRQLWITHAGVLKALAFLRQQPDGRIHSAEQWPRQSWDFGAWGRL